MESEGIRAGRPVRSGITSHGCGVVVGDIVRRGLLERRHVLVGVRVVLKLVSNEAQAVLALSEDLRPTPHPDPSARCRLEQEAPGLAFAVGAALGEVGHVSSHEHEVPLNCLEIERSEEHTSELQSIMRNSYAVFCWKKKKPKDNTK